MLHMWLPGLITHLFAYSFCQVFPVLLNKEVDNKKLTRYLFSGVRRTYIY